MSIKTCLTKPRKKRRKLPKIAHQNNSITHNIGAKLCDHTDKQLNFSTTIKIKWANDFISHTAIQNETKRKQKLTDKINNNNRHQRDLRVSFSSIATNKNRSILLNKRIQRLFLSIEHKDFGVGKQSSVYFKWYVIISQIFKVEL